MANNTKNKPIDWSSDPELRALYNEFVSSFAARAEMLKKHLENLKSSLPSSDTYVEIQNIAHQLAGAAGTYGFGSLTDLGGALDDWIEFRGHTLGGDGPNSAIRFTQILLDAIEEARKTGADPRATRSRAESVEFISAAEALASGSTS